jgi:hypothetical protein
MAIQPISRICRAVDGMCETNPQINQGAVDGGIEPQRWQDTKICIISE